MHQSVNSSLKRVQKTAFLSYDKIKNSTNTETNLLT